MGITQSRARKLADEAKDLAIAARELFYLTQGYEALLALHENNFNEEFQKVIIDLITERTGSWCGFIGNGRKAAWADNALLGGNWAEAHTQIQGAVSRYNLPLRFTERLLEARLDKIRKEK